MTKTVLIVEDNELNMKLFRDLLEAHGIATIETRSGLNVLDIARAQKPDLILMDIQLPEVSGLDVTKWLKADAGLKAIPVIAVTAFAMKGDEEKIRQGGCEDYISKPISVMRFLDVIRTHLAKQETQNGILLTKDDGQIPISCEPMVYPPETPPAEEDVPAFQILDRGVGEGDDQPFLAEEEDDFAQDQVK